MKPSLRVVIGDELIEIDGQTIEIPAHLARGATRHSDLGFTKFLEKIVYIVGHKRLNFEQYTKSYAQKSGQALRDSRYEALLKACCNFSTWPDSNWVITKLKNANELLARKGGSTLQVKLHKNSVQGNTAQLRPDDLITVNNTCFRPNLSIGYLFVISPLGPPTVDEHIARIYLNCTAKGACLTLLDLSRYATKNKLKFQAKFRNNPSEYCSSDSGVLYLSAEDFTEHRGPLTEMLRAHVELFMPRSSYFVTDLLPGVGFGIETIKRKGANRSFGEVEAATFVRGLLNPDVATPSVRLN